MFRVPLIFVVATIFTKSVSSFSSSSRIPSTQRRFLHTVPNAPSFLQAVEFRTTLHSTQPKPSDDIVGESSPFGPEDDATGPLVLLLFSQFVLFMGVGAVIPSIPLYGKALGFSSAANGIVISVPAVALLLLSKWGSRYADQARKPAMIFGMAIIALSDLGTSLANGLPMLLVARLGLGTGRSISESGERGLLADLANQMPTMRGRALAAQQAVAALGIGIGAPIGGVVVEQYGPRAAFLCVTAAALVAMVLYCFLPETQLVVGIADEDGRVDDGETPVWGKLLSLNSWRGLALAQSGASFGFAAKIASIPVLAASTLPGGAVGAGALISAAGLSGIFGAPIGGLLTDRVGAKTVAVASGIISATSLLLIPVALGLSTLKNDQFSVSFHDITVSGNAVAFVMAVLGWSAASAAQGPALTALAQRLAPKGFEATSLALPKAAGDATYIVAPFLLGLVTDRYTNLLGIECAFAGSATLVGILALAVLGADEMEHD